MMGFWRGLAMMATLLALTGSAAAQRRAAIDPAQRLAAEAEFARFVSPTLARFNSEDEFRRYLGALLAVRRARGAYYGNSGRIQFAEAQAPGNVQSDTVQPICPPSDPECNQVLQHDDDSPIVVTGSRIAAPNNHSVAATVPISAQSLTASPTNGQITNNQMQNVDEGDIVKQIGQFLLVLQDGRIFVIDTRAGGRPGSNQRLALADRANVYRDPRAHMWYDEMLVFGDRILITGYSYAERATELSVFRLDPHGRLAREGVFYMSSNDYYSDSNYATRLIGDNLVVYTPFSAQSMTYAGFKWPVVRRWVEGEDRAAAAGRGRPLFDAGQIYRPVRDVEAPTVHTVSVCPLGRVGPGRDLECRSTAFVGQENSQWYVTETDAFLWTSDSPYRYQAEDCAAGRVFANADFVPALLYRVPVNGAAPGLVAARGTPPDQFSLDSRGGHFRALLTREAATCHEARREEARLAFLDLPWSAFGATLAEVPESRYTPLPGVKSLYIANRFTARYLVYGSLGRYRRGLSERSMPPAYAVPVDRPWAAVAIPVHHTVIRAEQAGNDIVLTGYRDSAGLMVTLIDLDGRPRVASSVRLAERFEGEGRSHAFNSLIAGDGSGVMGLPTIGGESISSRAAWRSSASDLSFLTVDRQGRLRPVGELERRFEYGTADDEDEGIAGYECEVSCIDWYGNSRPIFTDGRVFALTGTEIIEGRIFGGEIQEVQRLNIALAAPARLASR
jgi:hypothetical protein